MEEMDTDYLSKYDLLGSYFKILMHEALKNSPANKTSQVTGTSARIISLFLDLLERQFPVDSPQQPLKYKAAKRYA